MGVQIVYDAITNSGGFYNSPVDVACRSLMNVPFTIPSDAELGKSFVAEAAKLGMVRALPRPYIHGYHPSFGRGRCYRLLLE